MRVGSGVANSCVVLCICIKVGLVYFLLAYPKYVKKDNAKGSGSFISDERKHTRPTYFSMPTSKSGGAHLHATPPYSHLHLYRYLLQMPDILYILFNGTVGRELTAASHV